MTWTQTCLLAAGGSMAIRAGFEVWWRRDARRSRAMAQAILDSMERDRLSKRT